MKTKTNEYKTKDAIQEAIEYGIDVTLIYERKKSSPTERIERHQQALEFVEELKKAGKKKHGEG